MATTLNLSSSEAPIGNSMLNKELAASKACAEGAVLVGTDLDAVDNPSGAAAVGLIGIARSAVATTDSGIQRRVSIGRAGIHNVLLAASASVTAFTDILITSNNSGHVKAWTNETNVDVIGVPMITRAAGAGGPEMIPVMVNIYRKT